MSIRVWWPTSMPYSAKGSDAPRAALRIVSVDDAALPFCNRNESSLNGGDEVVWEVFTRAFLGPEP